MPKIFRVILPVDDIDKAAHFYGQLLNQPGRRVSSGRHYFDCGSVILACLDPRRDGDRIDPKPNPEHVYFSVPDLDAIFDRAKTLGCRTIDEAIVVQPWGERSFYAIDPFGNPICFVDEKTVFTGKDSN